VRSLLNLGDLIDRSRDASKAALIDLGGERPPRELSYRALDRQANGYARLLAHRGLAGGSRVAILSANRGEFVAACFGIMRAGLVAVPVNLKFPPRLIDYVLADSDAELVLCDSARRAHVPARLPVLEFGGETPGADAFDSVQPEPRQSAMFLYTSGSTGEPKGVVLSHESHLWVVKTRLAGKDWSSQRLLVAAPLYHMNALALAQFAAAAHATVVLLPQFTARTYIDAVERYRCTWLTAVPPMMAMMLRERELLERTDLSSVQIIRMGSAPVSASLMAGLRHYFPRASIVNAYGTTEAGPVVFAPHPKGLQQPETSVGYPHPQVELRLADGVLQMKCPALMTEYHKKPEATRKAFTGDGYYITGDVFRRDEQGFYYFLGRTDDMFVSGGENIYPSEVEKMLEMHPAVEQAAVIAVPDDIKGAKPVAFVVLKRGRELNEEEIKHYALENAPAYQHPRRVWFLEELPLAGTNKIDRKALAQRAQKEMATP
jgi:acyl-CoA synthetase (AMP-forming)/AMP-acid ligase II